MSQVQLAVRRERGDRQPKAYSRYKPVCEAAVALVALIGLFPLIILIAAVILVSVGRPIIVSQPRLTAGGRVFSMYKFRTLTSNGSSRTHSWMPPPEEVTRVGKFLRRSRLDELPQLVNVLKGEMALVGPRPNSLALARKLSPVFRHWRQRLEVKGGMTGLAQIRCRRAQSFDDYADVLRNDLCYVRRMSWRLDLKILLLTPWALIRGI